MRGALPDHRPVTRAELVAAGATRVTLLPAVDGRHGDSAGDLPVRTPTVARDAP